MENHRVTWLVRQAFCPAHVRDTQTSRWRVYGLARQAGFPILQNL
jgi:hypothetical protein